MGNQVSSYIHNEVVPNVKFDSNETYSMVKIESNNPDFELTLFFDDHKDLVNFKNSVLQAYEAFSRRYYV